MEFETIVLYNTRDLANEERLFEFENALDKIKWGNSGTFGSKKRG